MQRKRRRLVIVSNISGSKARVRGSHAECGVRAYNGGLEAEPPAGSRGKTPGGQEVSEQSPMKLSVAFVRTNRCAISTIFIRPSFCLSVCLSVRLGLACIVIIRCSLARI